MFYFQTGYTALGWVEAKSHDAIIDGPLQLQFKVRSLIWVKN